MEEEEEYYVMRPLGHNIILIAHCSTLNYKY